jgi:uncharacterized protein (TIGR03067 family)
MARKALGITVLLLAAGLAGCNKTAGPPDFTQANDAVKKLQGTWSFVTINRAGKEASETVVKDSDVTIQDDCFTWWERKAGSPVFDMKHGEEFTLQVNPAKAATEVDLAYRYGDKEGQARKAIYSLEGDELKICMAEVREPRPTAFAATTKPATTLLVLRRKP